MSKVYFISDLHLGHNNMALYRGFKNVEEHDRTLIDNFNSVVSKRDITYILGDITMEKNNYELLGELKGRKIVILGNHDKKQHVEDLLKYVDSVVGCVQYKGYMLSHIPIHPMEFDYRVKGNIHGHLHEKSVMLGDKPDPRYISVCAEKLNFTPRLFGDLIK